MAKASSLMKKWLDEYARTHTGCVLRVARESGYGDDPAAGSGWDPDDPGERRLLALICWMREVGFDTEAFDWEQLLDAVE